MGGRHVCRELSCKEVGGAGTCFPFMFALSFYVCLVVVNDDNERAPVRLNLGSN